MEKKIIGCEKAMDNAPCGNNLERLCIGELRGRRCSERLPAASAKHNQQARKSCFGAYIFNLELFVW